MDDSDSDCDPSLLTYPIPGNDDNDLTIYLYSAVMRHAILDGRKRSRWLKRASEKVPDLSESSPEISGFFEEHVTVLI